MVRQRATVTFSPTSPASTSDGEIFEVNPVEPKEAATAEEAGPVAQTMSGLFGKEWLSEAAKYAEVNPVKPREAGKAEGKEETKAGTKWFQTATGWNKALGDALSGN